MGIFYELITAIRRTPTRYLWIFPLTIVYTGISGVIRNNEEHILGQLNKTIQQEAKLIVDEEEREEQRLIYLQQSSSQIN